MPISKRSYYFYKISCCYLVNVIFLYYFLSIFFV
nr:MAG TPA: hypothetical protein [Caudoviricetes sp.]